MKEINQLLSAGIFATGLVSTFIVADTLVGGEIRPLEVKQDLISTLQSMSKASGSSSSDIKINGFKSDKVWFTYRVPMEPNNGMPCCFRDDYNHFNDGKPEMMCNLESLSNQRGNRYWGNSHNSDNSDVLDIYFKFDGKKPTEMFYAGSDCPVDASDQQVYQFNDIGQSQSIAFLSAYVEERDERSDRRTSDRALAAIALHRGQQAQTLLNSYSQSLLKKVRHNAIFWLGEARNEAGYHSLVRIIEDKSRDIKTRSHSVFALSQNGYERSTDKLVQLAKNNGEEKIQTEAIFWLAETDKEVALDVITSVLNRNESPRVRKKTIFSLSQLDTEESWELLVEIAKSSDNKRDREEAVFWLSQNRNRDAAPILLELIANDPSRSIKEKAVFALSQLPDDLATPALISLLKNANNRAVKKKALFWLGQSRDPKALEALEDILTASVN